MFTDMHLLDQLCNAALPVNLSGTVVTFWFVCS